MEEKPENAHFIVEIRNTGEEHCLQQLCLFYFCV